MTFAIAPAAHAALSIIGSAQLFPVRRVYCVGRNYASHIREMGFDPSRELPFFFCKPNDPESVVAAAPEQAVAIPYPPQTANFHYEAELVVAIGKAGSDIPVGDAAAHIYGYAAGLDMTRRDQQMAARDKGRPWEVGKAFDFSAPVGPLTRREDAGALERAHLTLDVDGHTRQASSISHLIWSVDEIIAQLSTLFELRPGDLIFTGTPEGVGPVTPGQAMIVRIDGLAPLSVAVR